MGLLDDLRRRRRSITERITEILLARRLKAHGVLQAEVVIAEAKRAGLRLCDALAMLQKETGIPQRNVFGCDWGPQGGRPPYCGDAVTAARVSALLASGKANGVGWTQLTWPAFVVRAQTLGGAHLPKYQMRVGFDVLVENQRREGSRREGFRAYNGTGPAAEAYATEAMKFADRWQQIITR